MRPALARTVILILSLAGPLVSFAAQDRVPRSIDNNNVRAVSGTLHPLARRDDDAGEVDDATVLHRISLRFRPTPEQQLALQTLLREQQDPASPNHHRWLTPEQYAERFGLSEGDMERICVWLQQQGFTVVERARGRTYVAFRGTAAQVRSAFRTAIHRYTRQGEEHYANLTEPVLPAAIAGVVSGVGGLHDFGLQPRDLDLTRVVRPRFTSEISGNHFLAPDDFATIYNLKPLYNAGIDGTGQTIVVAAQSRILLSDVQTFRSVAGLTANDPQFILVPGSPDPGVVSGDSDESSLDVEWAGAVAPKATVVLVTSAKSAGGVLSAWQYVIDQNLAPVLTISYGNCEANFAPADLTMLSAEADKANAQGITLTAASGDQGTGDCENSSATIATHGLAVDAPSSIPGVTGVGGTRFSEGTGTYWSATNNRDTYGSALSYIPEIVWNETSDPSNDGTLSAGGGGVSKVFSKPSWQTGAGVPNDGHRDVPDVSLAASPLHDGYLICSAGSCINGFRKADSFLNVIGGTSAGSPAFAGIVALIDQQTQSRQGNVNPRLYSLAGTSPDAFHDITAGDNKVPCQAGTTDCPSGGQIGFAAGPAYDLATGLGSVDVYRLVTEWQPISLFPPTAKFGNVVLGAYRPLAITLGNQSGAPLAISNIGVSGNFGVSNDCPGTLNNGSTCTITITYHATSQTSDNGTLTVTDNGAGSPRQLAITATGVDIAVSTTRPARPTRSTADGVVTLDAAPAVEPRVSVPIIVAAPATAEEKRQKAKRGKRKAGDRAVPAKPAP